MRAANLGNFTVVATEIVGPAVGRDPARRDARPREPGDLGEELVADAVAKGRGWPIDRIALVVLLLPLASPQPP